jgi:hypothetical protein
MSQTVKVKIERVSDKNCWYKDLIGSEFEVRLATILEYIVEEDNQKLIDYKKKNSIKPIDLVSDFQDNNFYDSLRFLFRCDCKIIKDKNNETKI